MKLGKMSRLSTIEPRSGFNYNSLFMFNSPAGGVDFFGSLNKAYAQLTPIGVFQPTLLATVQIIKLTLYKDIQHRQSSQYNYQINRSVIREQIANNNKGL